MGDKRRSSNAPTDRRHSKGGSSGRRSVGSGGGEWYINAQQKGNVPVFRETTESQQRRSGGGGALQLIPTEPLGGAGGRHSFGSSGRGGHPQKWFFMWPSGAKNPPQPQQQPLPPQQPTAQLVSVPWTNPDGTILEQQFIAIDDMSKLMQNHVQKLVPLNPQAIPKRHHKRRSSSLSTSESESFRKGSKFTPKQLKKIVRTLSKYSQPPCTQLQPFCANAYGNVYQQSRQKEIVIKVAPSAENCIRPTVYPDTCTIQPYRNLEPVAQMGMEAIAQLGLNARRNMELEPLRHMLNCLQPTNASKPKGGNLCMESCQTQTQSAAQPIVVYPPQRQPAPANGPIVKTRDESSSPQTPVRDVSEGPEEPPPVPKPKSPSPPPTPTSLPPIDLCPYCEVGIFIRRKSLTGYLCAILCFPCGLYCCLSKRFCVITECSYCHAVSDGNTEMLREKCMEEIRGDNLNNDEGI